METLSPEEIRHSERAMLILDQMASGVTVSPENITDLKDSLMWLSDNATNAKAKELANNVINEILAL